MPIQYGAIIDIGLGSAFLLHNSEIEKFFAATISNPSELLSIGQTLEVYINNTDDGYTNLSLIPHDAKNKSFSLLNFFKNKLAS